MTNTPQPSTHAEAAAQTDKASDETTESQRERVATMEREYKLKLEVSERNTLAVTKLAEAHKEMEQESEGWLYKEVAAHDTTRKKLATMKREYKARLESMETMKREHEARLESMETMKREHEAEVEVLKGRVETSHHIYTESAAQTEEVFDKTTALPEETPEEIPTREEGG